MSALRASRRSMLAAAAMVPLAATLPGCASRGDGPLTLWAIGNEAASLPALLDDFGLVDLEVQALPWSGAHGKLLTGFVGGSLPDIAQVGNSWIAELAAIGAAQAVPANVAHLASGQFSAILETNRIGGKLVALPWYVDTRVQFYRKDLFARAGFAAPPTEWGAWKAALGKVGSIAGGSGFAVLLPLDEFEHLLTMSLSSGADFLRDEGTRGNFSAPEFVVALGFYKSLFDDGLAPVVSGVQLANRWAEFARGWFALYSSGPWMIEEMRTRLPADMQGQWATASNPGPSGPGAAAPGGSSLMVFAEGERASAAWQVVERLLAPGAQLQFHRATGDLPATKSVWTKAGLAADPVVAPFAAQLERARPLPKVPEWERIVNEMQVVAEAMVRGNLTVPQAAAEMDRRADALLAKRRWMAEKGRVT